MEMYNAKSLEMCKCTNCEIDKAGIECVANSLLYSREGQTLVKKQRWGSFAWEDSHRFEQFFGPDANNFWHGPYQAKEVAIPFIEHHNLYSCDKIDETDGRLLVFLNVVHDIQEAITGDRPHPTKTAESEREELDIQAKILKRVLKLSDFQLSQLRAIQDGSSHLSGAFKAMEYVGYLNTGLRAWAGREHNGLEEAEREKCYELGHAVLTKNVPQMQDMIPKYPYIGRMLELSALAISQANG